MADPTEPPSNRTDPGEAVPHFAEPAYGAPGDRAYLPAEAYGRALDALTIACVDLAFFDGTGERLLLGRRRRAPRNDWWLVGGRMFPGERPIATAQRKAAQEASLDIAPERLHFIGVYSTAFAQRWQPPQSAGLHSLNLTYGAQLTAAEQAAIDLDREEYDRWDWVARSTLADHLAPLDTMDRALLQVVADAAPWLERARP